MRPAYTFFGCMSPDCSKFQSIGVQVRARQAQLLKRCPLQRVKIRVKLDRIFSWQRGGGLEILQIFEMFIGCYVQPPNSPAPLTALPSRPKIHPPRRFHRTKLLFIIFKSAPIVFGVEIFFCRCSAFWGVFNRSFSTQMWELFNMMEL